MDISIQRGLNDKVYEKRKAAALDVEKTVREFAATDDVKKLHHVIAQLCELAASPHAISRSGAIMGLAAASIALGPKIADYLGAIVPPVLACFNDADSKVRYFACESMYNVAKVAKGEILVFFNELFSAISKLSADTELPVKNGAELLDRLIKDIVTEQASTYVSATSLPSPPTSPHLSGSPSEREEKVPDRAFSLARFIPLLQERIYVINPFTRTYLVSWLTVLDSVPELELVSFLPDFLDGLLKFLGDPSVDIRTATQNVLADFLRETREVAEVQKMREEEWRSRHEEIGLSQPTSPRPKSLTMENEDDRFESPVYDDPSREDSRSYDVDEGEGSGAWIPGQGVKIDHAAIVEILLQHLSFPDEEIQSTCLRWIAEFLLFVQPTMVPFAPRLIPVILSSLAHHVGTIRTAANETNYNLYRVIQDLPVHPSPPPAVLSPSPSIGPTSARDRLATASPPLATPPLPTSLQPTSVPAARQVSADRISSPSTANSPKVVAPPLPSTTALKLEAELNESTATRKLSLEMASLATTSAAEGGDPLSRRDPFDYGATVNALTLQFLNEHEETRVAALEWLQMLHQKAPKKILAVDDPSGGEHQTRSTSRSRPQQSSSDSGLSIALLLKMLSDSSEKVLRCDLQLLAQISSHSEEEYFPSFMMSLLELFSTDRKLLETRGSLIIRQLCASLNTERIYRTFAEILEKDEDLEFASSMVQNLNLIMITSPELAEFRKRLKNLESKDGQSLFTVLYRSWSHNAVATFSLCLLAQAYEQASSLLQIFADLEITVSLLIQVDKLVQLIESPVFTSLRLQLLEPERYPHLLKAMYGLLMLLPQSSAFATLRNRLSAVSALGFLQTVPKASYVAAATTTRSTTSHIRWNELLTWFRQVQTRHERSRRSSSNNPSQQFSTTDSQQSSMMNGYSHRAEGGGGHSAMPIVASAGGSSNPGRALRKKLPLANLTTGLTTRGSGIKVSTSVGSQSVAGRPTSPTAIPKRRLTSAPLTSMKF